MTNHKDNDRTKDKKNPQKDTSPGLDRNRTANVYRTK